MISESRRVRLESLRQDLLAADYRHDTVHALLGEQAESARQRGVLTPAKRVLAERTPGPLATLIRLFLLGEELSLDEAGLAFMSLGVGGAAALGLIETLPDERCRAIVSLDAVSIEDSVDVSAARPLTGATVHHDWWILSDLGDATRGGPVAADHVMGVGGATRSLIAQLPVTTSGLSLDLGTGCGIVAMHLSLRGPVIATDLSARALRFASANAVLNDRRDLIEFRQGSLFEPISEKFDLIASNPPFVVTPRLNDTLAVLEYRDGGMVGDDLMKQVVTHAPEHLTDTGQFVCLGNWECPWGSDGLERVGEWIQAAASQSGPVGAWVIERDRLSPIRYAQTWIRDGGVRPGSQDFEALMSAWLTDFEQRRVTAVGLGTIRLAKLSSDVYEQAIVRLERVQEPAAHSQLAATLQSSFEQGLLAAKMSDDEVLSCHWVCDERVREVREHRPGVEAPNAISLHIDAPFERSVQADPLLAAAVGACDGDLSLAQIAEALATLLEVDHAACSQVLVESVRELTWLGMLRMSGK